MFAQTPGQSATLLLKKASQELLQYLNGKRKNFDLPLHPKGTNFQLEGGAGAEKAIAGVGK